MNGQNLSMIAPAKINLFLELLSRRPDGYHEIETVMAPIDLYDEVTLSPSGDDQIRLSVVFASAFSDRNSGSKDANSQDSALNNPDAQNDALRGDVPGDQNNLVYQAIELFREKAGIQSGVNARLLKRIPSQAGLGGASSDAAATLILANRFWQVNWPVAKLSELAAQLGSDVPFFLQPHVALCQGRGEKVTPLSSRLEPSLVLVKPPVGFSTPEIFRRHEQSESHLDSQPATEALASGSLRGIANAMFNRLEQAASTMSDWVQLIKNEFGKTLSYSHQLTGSGSCYFGLFPNDLTARQASKMIAARLSDCQVYCCRLLRRSSILPNEFKNCDGVQL